VTQVMNPRKTGYVRIYRSLIGHSAFRDDAEAMAFAFLVLRASWRDARLCYRRRLLDLKRGQLAMTFQDLADHLDRDKGWVERLFSRLKDETMIETTVVKKLLVITICNYDEYQADPGTGVAPAETIDGTRERRRRDVEQGREELKEYSLSEDRGQPGRKKILEAAVEALRSMGARKCKAREAVMAWQTKYSDEVILRTIESVRSTHGGTNPIAFASYWLNDFALLHADQLKTSRQLQN
jgi:hypothetical protein